MENAYARQTHRRLWRNKIKTGPCLKIMLERRYQPSRSYITHSQRQPPKHNPRSVDRRIKPVIGVIETRSPGRINIIDSPFVQPALPVRSFLHKTCGIIMQKRRVFQDGVVRGHAETLHKFRTGQREYRFIEKRLDKKTGIIASPKTQADIDLIDIEIGERQACGNAQLDIGMLIDKLVNPRRQPFCCEGRATRDNKHLVLRGTPDRPHGPLHSLKTLMNTRIEPASGLGESNRPVEPVEQCHLQLLFKLLDLVAQRGWRHEQLFSGLLETQQPSRGFESA